MAVVVRSRIFLEGARPRFIPESLGVSWVIVRGTLLKVVNRNHLVFVTRQGISVDFLCQIRFEFHLENAALDVFYLLLLVFLVEKEVILILKYWHFIYID